MSREDPQLRIRLPVELKEKIEETAKSNNRSMNAEIVKRLDDSFLNDIQVNEELSAQEAFKVACRARDELSKTVFKRTFSEINKKIRLGNTTFGVDLGDLELHDIEEDDVKAILSLTINKLQELGYDVPMDEVDSTGFIVDIPK